MLVSVLNLLILPLAALAGSTPTINDEPTRTLAVRQSHPETTIPCKIVNANGAVNCHEGPYLNSPVVRELYAGDYYEFNCYDLGDCYDDNWFVYTYLYLLILFWEIGLIIHRMLFI